MHILFRSLPGFLAILLPVASIADESGWSLEAPRDEIAVEGERKSETHLLLESPDRAGHNGFWEREFAVEGGTWVRFRALRQAREVEHVRRSCVVRIEWYGDDGGPVPSAHPVNPAYRGTTRDRARPDFPRDRGETAPGWVEVADTYPVPEEATRAVVQLHLRWAPGGAVEWRGVELAECEAPPARKVRLAAVHTQLAGGGRTVAENRERLRPLVEQAAVEGADLVVLPELLTCKGVTSDYASVAESIPGPTTEYFSDLARKHDCYLVVGLPERDDHLVYNTAVLLGPEGDVVGRYRKVTLPREEIARGISPGSEYPVFETRFGKVGLMICYDVFFPEVARELSRRGAEVIALPIWGGNPRLAAARCAENGIYLVSSTYTSHEHDWMKTAVWNREGDRIETAEAWDTIVIGEVDLARPTYWDGLGDFRSRIAREAPVRLAE